MIEYFFINIYYIYRLSEEKNAIYKKYKFTQN